VRDLEIVAFLDESKKPVRDQNTGKVAASGDHYVVAAAIVLSGDTSEIRHHLLKLVENLGHSLHYSEISKVRRPTALEGIVNISGWEGSLYETASPVSVRQPERRTRHRLLSTALADLTRGKGATQVTLESRATPRKGYQALDQHDHMTWRSLLDRELVSSGTTISHTDKSEPLLWIADLLAGVRTDFLCGVDRSLFSRVAHRVTSVTSVDC
jgi:hypothetical protein